MNAPKRTVPKLKAANQKSQASDKDALIKKQAAEIEMLKARLEQFIHPDPQKRRRLTRESFDGL